MVPARPRVGLPSSVKLPWEITHRRTKECVPRWFQIQPSWQWWLVITPRVRSHPSPINKQTHKQTKKRRAQFLKRVSFRSHWSPALVSYNAVFCFLCGIVGTRNCLTDRLAASLCAVCFLTHSLMAGICPYRLYPGSQLACTSIFYGWPCESTPFTVSLL